MSFYSSLILAANTGVRPPTPEEARELFRELGLLDPDDPTANTVSDAVGELFRDPVARAENNRFFFPCGIDFEEGVSVGTPGGDPYHGPGWSVMVHGNGYFFPWELSELRERVTGTPMFVRLRAEVERRFGGRFVFPLADEAGLRERLIDTAGGWAWFADEDM